MQGGEPRVPRAIGLVALVESPPPPPSNLQRSASGKFSSQGQAGAFSTTFS